MAEQTIHNSNMVSEEDIQKLVVIANAHIAGEREALQQALDGEVDIPNIIRHTNNYVRFSSERTKITEQITQIDTNIAMLEEQDKSDSGAVQTGQAIAVLLSEQDQLAEQLKALPNIQQQDSGGNSRRKLTFLEKLYIRFLFAVTAPVNEAREALRNIALESARSARILTGKVSWVMSIAESIQTLRTSPSALAEQITSNQASSSLARSERIAVWYNKSNGSQGHRSKRQKSIQRSGLTPVTKFRMG